MRKVTYHKPLSVVLAMATLIPSLFATSSANTVSPLQAKAIEKKESLINASGHSLKTSANPLIHRANITDRKNTKERSDRKDGTLCEVSIQATYDSEQYFPENGVLINKNSQEDIWLNENGCYNTSIPAGTYSLVFSFSKRNSIGEPLGSVCIVKDNIAIEEGTSIVLNPEEATRHIHFLPLKSNGEEIKLSKKRIFYNPIADEITEEVILEGGNVDFITFTIGLWNKEYGNVWSILKMTDSQQECIIENNPAIYSGAPTDLWITEAGEDWIASMNIFYGADETLYYASLIPEDKESLVSNIPDNYTEFVYPAIQQSFWGESQEYQPDLIIKPEVLIDQEGIPMPTPPSIAIEPYIEKYGKLYSILKFYETNNIAMRSKINSFIRFPRNDAVTNFEEDTIWISDNDFLIETSIWFSKTNVPPIYLHNGQTRCVYNMEDAYFYSSGDTIYDLYNRCWHPWLPTFSQISALTYNSTPQHIMSFISGNHNRYQPGLGLYLISNDNYACSTSTYILKGDWHIEYNGNPISINKDFYPIPEYWAWERDNENAPKGEYKLTFTTPEDRIGGLPSNTTFVACIDQRKEDCTAPAIQLLNFVNTEREFTNEFTTPEDGILRFVGGDFDWSDETNMPYSKDCEMVIEASPYHLDSWESISPRRVEVEAPIYFAPAYEVALGSLTSESESGWFDLRITMTDEYGNYMTQTISPAFKVESLSTGVEAIDSVSDIHIDGRNIIAPANARIFSINGTPVTGHDLQPGIYLVTFSGSAKKVIVK